MVPCDMHQLYERASHLLGADLESRSHDSLRLELRDFLRTYTALGVPEEPQHIWHRARKCESEGGYSNLAQMLYPPTGSPNYGRAQLPGSKVLYASWNKETALDESDAQSGDIFQLISFRVAPGQKVPCHPVGEYQSYHSTGRSMIRSGALEREMDARNRQDPDQFKCSAYIDSVVSSFFRRHVERGCEHKYKLSAIYSEILYPAEGAIIYPSVRNATGRNIAIPAVAFDGKFEVLFTGIIRVERSLGFGFYQIQPIRTCFDFAENGDIRWDSEKTCTVGWTPQGGMNVDLACRGWRKK